MTQIEFLTSIIQNSQYGVPIYTRVLSEKMAVKFGLNQKKAYTATSVSMKRIMDNHIVPDLKFHQRGIYYLAKTTPFGDTPIDSDILVFDRYIANDNGYESGLGELHALGLVTQMPRKRLIVSNAAYRNAKTDVKHGIVIKQPKIAVNKDNKVYLQILDAIEIVDKSPVDATDPYGRLYSYIEKAKMDFIKLLSLANNYYGKDVVLKLGKIASTGERL